MIETSLSLVPFLIADIVNPVLFAFLVYAAGSAKPVLTSSAMLLGHTTAYFIAGIGIALGLEQVTAYLANPSQVDYLIGLVIGLLLLWLAIPVVKKPERKKPDKQRSMSILSGFGIGAVVNFIGVPFALPYFAAIDQILKADLVVAEVLLLLLLYNVLYALPFLTVPIMVVIFGERSKPMLQQINAWLDRVSGFLVPVMLGLLGLVLVADAILYFVYGEGLF